MNNVEEKINTPLTIVSPSCDESAGVFLDKSLKEIKNDMRDIENTVNKNIKEVNLLLDLYIGRSRK